MLSRPSSTQALPRRLRALGQFPASWRKEGHRSRRLATQISLFLPRRIYPKSDRRERGSAETRATKRSCHCRRWRVEPIQSALAGADRCGSAMFSSHEAADLRQIIRRYRRLLSVITDERARRCWGVVQQTEHRLQEVEERE